MGGRGGGGGVRPYGKKDTQNIHTMSDLHAWFKILLLCCKVIKCFEFIPEVLYSCIIAVVAAWYKSQVYNNICLLSGNEGHPSLFTFVFKLVHQLSSSMNVVLLSLVCSILFAYKKQLYHLCNVQCISIYFISFSLTTSGRLTCIRAKTFPNCKTEHMYTRFVALF